MVVPRPPLSLTTINLFNKSFASLTLVSSNFLYGITVPSGGG